MDTQRFQQTKLWQATLATQLEPDLEADNRRRLRTSLESLRERASILSGEIARSLPDYTTHDLSHLDALWEMAQLICGDQFSLTPPEAFVLGGAFLIHDLGMALAAYPAGLSSIESHVLWKDTLFAEMRRKLGRKPTSSDIENLDPAIERIVVGKVLRQLHAERAEKLALVAWNDSRGHTFHLIEDNDLRQLYGRVIGLVAHSHWWSVDEMHNRLPGILGAPGGYAQHWTVDALKLACILRCADASHLDQRRAPGFLRTLRNPDAASVDHWVFQEKLYQPRLEGDRLVFTSSSSFSLDEASAWWLCHDTLHGLDRELNAVDALLVDTKRPRFAARAVAYIDSPERLAKLIPTDGWTPIDARIKVGAVASLVKSLGGEELYGPDLLVPLRELIQNATDAVRARRMLEALPEEWGHVTVSVTEDEQGTWIEVEDTGVGMSPAVLAGPFLDFGTSFWGSSMMHSELPGLEATGFSATGKYGIGFFSVFMWGDKVQVISRRFEKGREGTWVLEFAGGLEQRPILRLAQTSEYLKNGGTKVRVLLESTEIYEEILHSRHRGGVEVSLSDVCERLCATSDCNIEVNTAEEGVRRVISASDWMHINGPQLLQRIFTGYGGASIAAAQPLIQDYGEKLQPLTDEQGRLIGRFCLAPMLQMSSVELGQLTVGGLASSGVGFSAGVLTGIPITASRHASQPMVSAEALAAFASAEAHRLHSSGGTGERFVAALTVRIFGGDPGPLPIAECNGSNVVSDEARLICEAFKIILVVDVIAIENTRRYADLKLHENVMITSSHSVSVLSGERASAWPRSWAYHSITGKFYDADNLPALIGEIAASAWGCEAEDVLAYGKQYLQTEIGTVNGSPFVTYCYRIVPVARDQIT